MTVVDLVTPDGGIAVGGDPHAGEIVGVNFVVDELSEAIFVHVYAPCLTVVDFAMNYRRICAGFNLKTSDTIIVDIVGLKVSLKIPKYQL